MYLRIFSNNSIRSYGNPDQQLQCFTLKFSRTTYKWRALVCTSRNYPRTIHIFYHHFGQQIQEHSMFFNLWLFGQGRPYSTVRSRTQKPLGTSLCSLKNQNQNEQKKLSIVEPSLIIPFSGDGQGKIWFFRCIYMNFSNKND